MRGSGRNLPAFSAAQKAVTLMERSSPAVSWTQLKANVKMLPTLQVVIALGIRPYPSGGPKEFFCPKHCGNPIRVYDANAYCHRLCRGMDNIDLVRAVYHLDFSEAVNWLVKRFPEAGPAPR